MSNIVEKAEQAIREVPLSLSSTRRRGENGLRNADEVLQAALSALNIIVLERGAQYEAGDFAQINTIEKGTFYGIYDGANWLHPNIIPDKIISESIRSVELIRRNNQIVIQE